MRAFFSPLLLVLAGTALFSAQDNPAGGPRPLAFTHVGVIDATARRCRPT